MKTKTDIKLQKFPLSPAKPIVTEELFACKKSRVCKKKTSSLRLAKRQKAEFTYVNEHFCRKRNEKIGVFLQTLNKLLHSSNEVYHFQKL
jgi:hypothetical protein